MELWDLYDEHRAPLGRTHQRGLPLAPGEYHLAVIVVIVNSRGEVLLTRRSPEKAVCPGWWENTGGAVQAGESSLQAAVRELREETGVTHAALVSREIFSLEILTVDGHIKRGAYVPSHLHFNVTYLAEADEQDPLTVNESENQAVAWWSLEDALKVSKEAWMVEHIYKKLAEKCRRWHLPA